MVSLKGLLQKIISWISAPYYLTSAAVSSVAITAGQYVTGTITPTSVTGYECIGLIGLTISGTMSTYCVVSRWYLSSGVINYLVRNYGTSDASITIRAYLLYVRTS